MGFAYGSPDKNLGLGGCTAQLLNAASFVVYSRLRELQSHQSQRTLHLTEREREVLRWIAAGKTKSEIGEELFISQSAVKRHCEHISQKLGTPTMAASVAEAIKRGELRSL